MKRFLIVLLVFLCSTTIHAKEDEPDNLHARSAVLIDADSGRVLFEKNGYEKMPMASTTKIMTCIVALEKGELDSVVTASKRAVRQPKVHLGMKEGEQFLLEDLLYSLMLESHNDSAVAIAENIAGSVEDFANLMNQKAKEIGCEKTYFITPNGLDETDSVSTHSTTAAELARIMKYCICESPKKALFLKITQTPNKTFTNIEKTRNFSCANHNAFLGMMDGALSGKTGFTADAGYCYVGALKRGKKMFVVALLACGWPNNKHYKWEDTRKLMRYAIENYEYKQISPENQESFVEVLNGVPGDEKLFGKAFVELGIENETFDILLNKNEKLEVKSNIKQQIQAPINYGTKVGTIDYYLNGNKIKTFNVIVKESVKRKDYKWYFKKISEIYFLEKAGNI